MISVIAWRWGHRFGAHFVNRLRAMLARHLHVPHSVFCVTDNIDGFDHRIKVVAPPDRFRDTPRCRRRMLQYDRAFGLDDGVGDRILSIDLDMVIVDDITPIVNRSEPLVCWRVGYAGVYCPAFILYDRGHLHGMFEQYVREPDAFPQRAQPRGVGSDQAMLNLYLHGQVIPHWTEADGFVSYFGTGYERQAHHGLSPANHSLPKGARIVAFGGADIAAMEGGAIGFVRRHWKE
jgi:hypothetical protein